VEQAFQTCIEGSYLDWASAPEVPCVQLAGSATSSSIAPTPSSKSTARNPDCPPEQAFFAQREPALSGAEGDLGEPREAACLDKRSTPKGRVLCDAIISRWLASLSDYAATRPTPRPPRILSACSAIPSFDANKKTRPLRSGSHPGGKPELSRIRSGIPRAIHPGR
jgi:hypothetical protein